MNYFFHKSERDLFPEMNKLDSELVMLCLDWLHPAQRSFTRLVCKKWWTPVERADVALYIAQEGYVDLMSYLQERGYPTSRIRHLAAHYGQIEMMDNTEESVVQAIMAKKKDAFFHLLDKTILTTRSLYISAEYGDLDILKAVYAQVPEKAIHRVTTWEKYSWLRKKGQKPMRDESVCKFYCQDVRIIRNVVKGFRIDPGSKFLKSCLCTGLGYGNINLCEYLGEIIQGITPDHEHRLYTCAENEEAILWVYDHYPRNDLIIRECIRINSISLLAKFRGETSDIIAPWPYIGQYENTFTLSTLMWLRSDDRLHGPMPWNRKMAERFIEREDWEAIHWMIERPGIDLYPLFWNAVRRGKLEVIKYFLQVNSNLRLNRSASTTLNIKNKESFWFLIDNNLTSSTPNLAIYKSVKKADCESLERIRERFPDIWNGDLYEYAAMNKRTCVLDWLYTREDPCPLPMHLNKINIKDPDVARWFRDRGLI